ncbi:MAG: DUF1330 domain-containing protein [Myxococcota bacterium]|nr:DUF1330 domain-containing protein [Myxococcota bacterium]
MQIDLYPSREQIETLLADTSDDPVVMINLLCFKGQSDGDDDLLGSESYARYAAPMREIVEGQGGRFLWLGRVDSQVIGSGADGVDMVALVEYPSRKKFVEIATSDAVREIGSFREGGLAGQWLLASTTLGGIDAEG